MVSARAEKAAIGAVKATSPSADIRGRLVLILDTQFQHTAAVRAFFRADIPPHLVVAARRSFRWPDFSLMKEP